VVFIYAQNGIVGNGRIYANGTNGYNGGNGGYSSSQIGGSGGGGGGGAGGSGGKIIIQTSSESLLKYVGGGSGGARGTGGGGSRRNAENGVAGSSGLSGTTQFIPLE
jgi:hypothetical protein